MPGRLVAAAPYISPVNSIAKSHDHPAEVRRTLQLATPVILGQVAIFSMSFVNAVMSGRLPDKEVSLAALGIGGAVWSALMMFTIGLLMAVQPSVAQLDGAGRKLEAATLTRQALWIALMVAVPFWAYAISASPCCISLASTRHRPGFCRLPGDFGRRVFAWCCCCVFQRGSGHTAQP
jgi:Na+-driven multidrug efflux pump